MAVYYCSICFITLAPGLIFAGKVMSLQEEQSPVNIIIGKEPTQVPYRPPL